MAPSVVVAVAKTILCRVRRVYVFSLEGNFPEGGAWSIIFAGDIHGDTDHLAGSIRHGGKRLLSLAL